MEITVLGFVLGLLLLALPVYAVVALKLNMVKRLLLTYGWMAVLTSLLALVLWSAISYAHVWATLLFSLLLLIASAAITAGKVPVLFGRLFFPLLAGLLAGSLVVGLYVIFVVLGIRQPFDAHIFLPVVSLLLGSTVGINLKALNTYFAGLLHHNQLYEYLMGNGATHRQAVDYFVRRCLQAALIPVLRHMSGLVWSTAPVLLLALVLSGTSVWTALAIELLYPLMVLSTSFISLFITLFIGRHYIFDDYERLRVKRAPQSPDVALATPASAPEVYGDIEAHVSDDTPANG